jgi:hypothetical protein
MAKLSARGRTEVARLVKELPADETCSWRRKTFALMSDGVVLEKLDVEFRLRAYAPTRRHSYGWKVLLRTKATKERFVDWAKSKGCEEVTR